MESQSQKSHIFIGVFIGGILSSMLTIVVLGMLAFRYKEKVFATIAALVKVPAPQYVMPAIETPPLPVAPLPTTPTDLSIPDVVAVANPSVVSIEVSTDTVFGTQVVASGTGFFVSTDGMILTNRHVIDTNNARFVAVTNSGKRYTATLIAKDDVLDIALLRVQGKNFPAATLGNSDDLKLGQGVVAIGYALGQFKNSISSGVISGLSRSIVAGNGYSSEFLDKVIQTDAAINPGNSGGPLLDLHGNVIGVNVAAAQSSQSIGFALPINTIKTVIASVKKTGTIVRPYVGIYFQPVEKGILIASIDGTPAVVPGSPADRAGLLAGDIITRIDKTKITKESNFAGVIRDKKVGQRCVFHVVRGDIEKDITVVLEQAK